MEDKTTRRDFIKKSTLAVAGLSLSQRGFPLIDIDKKIIGANDRINTGFIGVGNRGTQLLHHFMEQPDCEVAGLCDVYQPYTSRNHAAVNPRYIKDMGRTIPKMGESFSKRV